MHTHAHVFFHYCALSLIILKQTGGKTHKQLKQKRKRVKATNEEEIKTKMFWNGRPVLGEARKARARIRL